MASNIVPHHPRATSQLQMLYFCKGSSLLTAQRTTICSCTVPLLCNLFKTATCIASRIIKHPISNCAAFGPNVTSPCPVNKTNLSNYLLQGGEGNICRLAIRKMYLSWGCAISITRVLFTGLPGSRARSQNTISNLGRKEKKVQMGDRVKEEEKRCLRAHEWVRDEEWGEEDERKARNYGGGNVVGGREERGGGGVVISQKCMKRTNANQIQNPKMHWVWIYYFYSIVLDR